MTVELNSFEELDQLPERVVETVRDIDYEPPLRAISIRLEELHALQFNSEVSPGGDPLQPLSQSTIATKGHDHILIDKRDLMASLAGKTGDSIRDVITGLEGQAVLRFGTRDPKSRRHQKGGRNLSQRKHVGTNEAGVKEMAQIIRDHIIGTLSSGALS